DGKEACYTQSGQWMCRFDLDGYRLPTEAEWEYLTRGGASKELLPKAATAMHDLGWFSPRANGKPQSVEQLIPNANGLYDTWGNVWEWCWDLYTPGPRDANGPASGTERTMWGGGWNETPEQVAQSPRRGRAPTYRSTDVGFRVVRTVVGR